MECGGRHLMEAMICRSKRFPYAFSVFQETHFMETAWPPLLPHTDKIIPSFFDGVEENFFSDGIFDALDDAHRGIVAIWKT